MSKSLRVKIYEEYGKHLKLIAIIVIGLSAFILWYGVYFQVWLWQIPYYTTVSLFSLIMLIFIITVHGFFIRAIAEREIYPDKIIYWEHWTSRLYWITLVILLLFLAIMYSLVYFFPNHPIMTTLANVLSWGFLIDTIFFVIFSSFTTFSLVTLFPHKKSRLYLKATLENIRKLSKMKKMERGKVIKKYFKWFRTGLQYYNTHIWSKMPERPEVIDLEKYFDSAYMVALIGNDKEVEDLVSNIEEAYASIGTKANEGDFRRFLIALQHIVGKRKKKDESTIELSKMIKTVSFSEKVVIPVSKIILGVPTLFVALMKIWEILSSI